MHAAGNGGSRNFLENLVHKIESGSPGGRVSTEQKKQQVLGLDVSDKKLRKCNAGGVVHCAKADLRQIFAKRGAAPLIDGVQMKDILEHINQPMVAGAESSIPPARKRTLGGQMYDTATHDLSFDTASHATAMKLWRAACAAAKRFCFMEGPGFDGEESLRALGYMRYYEAWSVHTCHLNSSSIVRAMTTGAHTHQRAGAQLVVLFDRITTSASPLILRQPPAVADRSCDLSNATKAAVGCDRHPLTRETYRKMEEALPPLLFPKSGPAVDLHANDIFRTMAAIHTFYDTPAEMSRVTAAVLERYGSKEDAKVVFCALSRSTLTGQACMQELLNAARRRLVSSVP